MEEDKYISMDNAEEFLMLVCKIAIQDYLKENNITELPLPTFRYDILKIGTNEKINIKG